jgi:hypothetical protein
MNHRYPGCPITWIEGTVNNVSKSTKLSLHQNHRTVPCSFFLFVNTSFPKSSDFFWLILNSPPQFSKRHATFRHLVFSTGKVILLFVHEFVEVHRRCWRKKQRHCRCGFILLQRNKKHSASRLCFFEKQTHGSGSCDFRNMTSSGP